MKRSVIVMAVLAGLSLGLSFVSAAPPKKGEKAGAKMDIDTIMKKAFKKGALYDKVKNHDASKAELQQFADYCKALIDQKPPKGDAASWKSKTTHLYELAAALAKGDESKHNALLEAATCKTCHNAHKDD